MTRRNAFLFLFALVFVAYINSLSNAFVSDDLSIAKSVPSWSWTDAFHEPYRLGRALLYFITYQLAGLTPLAFRIPNVLFHLGTTWIVFSLVALLATPAAAWIAAAIVAVHPLLTESVSWISGGVYVQYSFFVLLALYLYIRSYSLLSYVVFTLSLLSSEKAIPLVLLFPLYEFCYGNIRKNIKKIFPFVLIAGLFAIPYIFQIGKRTEAVQSVFYQNPGGMENPLIQIPLALGTYLRLLFWPDQLTIYHTEWPRLSADLVLPFFLFFVFLGALIWTLRKNRWIFFWLTLFPIALLPTLTPFRISWVVAERYSYPGIIGIIVAAGILLTSFIKEKKYLFPIMGIILIILSLRTIARNRDWWSEETLWLAIEKVSPGLPNVHHNLGVMYGNRNDFPNAIRQFQLAAALKPDWVDPYYNLALTYQRAGQFASASATYAYALKLNPNLWQPYRNLAEIAFAEKRFDDAITYLNLAIEKNPTNANLFVNLAIVYEAKGDIASAKAIRSKLYHSTN